MTVELDKKQLLDGLIIGGARRYADSRAQRAKLQIEAGSLLHHIYASEIGAASFQHFHYRLRHLVSVHVIGVAEAPRGVVFRINSGQAYTPGSRLDSGVNQDLDRAFMMIPAALFRPPDRGMRRWK